MDREIERCFDDIEALIEQTIEDRSKLSSKEYESLIFNVKVELHNVEYLMDLKSYQLPDLGVSLTVLTSEELKDMIESVEQWKISLTVGKMAAVDEKDEKRFTQQLRNYEVFEHQLM